MSSTLEDMVKTVVNDFVKNETLFTALDVSNAVKTSFPFAKHREVRDMVRAMYAEMQTSSYGRTPIQVKLADGSQVEALLYHHLSDSWDLDTKYDAQKRSQSTPTLPHPTAVSPVADVGVAIASNVPLTVLAPSVNVGSNTPVNIVDPKKLWNSLFTGVKLFPRS